MLGLTFDTPVGKRTFTPSRMRPFAREYWGVMTKTPAYPFAVINDPHLLTIRSPKRNSGPAGIARRRTVDLTWDLDPRCRLASAFDQFMGGLITAMFLFLIASGLSLVFGVMRVINFAHGSFYMLGAYLAWQAMQWLQPVGEAFWAAAIFAALGVAVLGGDRRAAAAAPPLRPRRALSAVADLCAGADLRRRRQVYLGHRPAFGVSARRCSPAASRSSAPPSRYYNLFIMALGPAIAVRRLAGADPQQRRPDGSGGLVRSRDGGGARRQCRRDLYRHVHGQLVSGRAERRAGHAACRASCRAWMC